MCLEALYCCVYDTYFAVGFIVLAALYQVNSITVLEMWGLGWITGWRTPLGKPSGEEERSEKPFGCDTLHHTPTRSKISREHPVEGGKMVAAGSGEGFFERDGFPLPVIAAIGGGEIGGGEHQPPVHQPPVMMARCDAAMLQA